jgi:hypothetical protein
LNRIRTFAIGKPDYAERIDHSEKCQKLDDNLVAHATLLNKPRVQQATVLAQLNPAIKPSCSYGF